MTLPVNIARQIERTNDCAISIQAARPKGWHVLLYGANPRLSTQLSYALEDAAEANGGSFVGAGDLIYPLQSDVHPMPVGILKCLSQYPGVNRASVAANKLSGEITHYLRFTDDLAAANALERLRAEIGQAAEMRVEVLDDVTWLLVHSVSGTPDIAETLIDIAPEYGGVYDGYERLT